MKGNPLRVPEKPRDCRTLRLCNLRRGIRHNVRCDVGWSRGFSGERNDEKQNDGAG